MSNSNLINQLIPNNYYQLILQFINKVNTLNLRKKDDKILFNNLLNKYLQDPNFIYYLFIYEEELKNDIKYLKNVWDILIENNSLNDFVLNENKLLKQTKKWF